MIELVNHLYWNGGAKNDTQVKCQRDDSFEIAEKRADLLDIVLI